VEISDISDATMDEAVRRLFARVRDPRRCLMAASVVGLDLFVRAFAPSPEDEDRALGALAALAAAAGVPAEDVEAAQAIVEEITSVGEVGSDG